MPFRALADGRLVVPATVSNRQPVTCCECGQEMYARGGEQKARHFYHVDERAGGDCSGPATGESSIHARCVALAVAALQDNFGEQAASIGAEMEVDVTGSGSRHQTRRADALVEFNSSNPFFGAGLVIEVQHQHEDKDIEMTTHDFLSAGYSVVWLSPEDFAEEKLDYTVVNESFEEGSRPGFSQHEYAPKQFIECEHWYYEGEHNWKTVPGYVLTCEEPYEICISRDCTIRRKFDSRTGEYTYKPDAITPPDLPLKVLKNTVHDRTNRAYRKRWLLDRYGDAALEKALADRPEIDQCPGPKGFHEWLRSVPIRTSRKTERVLVELYCCQHCSTHLITDFRGYEDERTDIFLSESPGSNWDLAKLSADPRKCEHPVHDENTWYGRCPECGLHGGKYQTEQSSKDSPPGSHTLDEWG